MLQKRLIFKRISSRIKQFIRNIWLKQIILTDAFLFPKRPKFEPELDKKLIFYGIAWGNSFVHNFWTYAVTSVLQEGNAPRLHRDGVSLVLNYYTDRKSWDYAQKNYSQIIKKLEEFVELNVLFLDKLLSIESICSNFEKQQATVNHLIKDCLDKKASCFLLISDIIIGNHSLYNIFHLSKGKNVSIASPHARVAMSILDEPLIKSIVEGSGTISSSQLVSMAMKHGTDGFLNSFEVNDKNSTKSGIALRRISKNGFCVVHNLLAPLFIKFHNADSLFFKIWPYNAMDKLWPRQLIKKRRFKYAGSSELFFMVELTPDKKNELIESGNQWNDEYSSVLLNMTNYFCNSVIAYWESDPSIELSNKIPKEL